MTWWSDKTKKEKDRCHDCPWLYRDYDGYRCTAIRDKYDETQVCCFCGAACNAFYFCCGIEDGDFETAKEVGKIVDEYWRKRQELKDEMIEKVEKIDGVIE